MSKLAKVKAKFAAAKQYAKSEGKEKLGSTGLLIAEFGTHAGLALASNAYPTLGPIPVSPSVAGFVASGIACAFTKGKSRKLANACLRGSGHALITGMIGAKKFTIVRGPNGEPVIKEESAAAA